MKEVTETPSPGLPEEHVHPSAESLSVDVENLQQEEPAPAVKPGTAGPIVGIIMGSKSDWDTLRPARDLLTEFGVRCEARVVSAHRTPDLLFDYAASAAGRGVRVIIAGAGGAAHLPGMCASKTHLPVLGVPVKSAVLNGVDSLLSIVQMPKGVPVATFAIGSAGAVNAALFAIAILATYDRRLESRLIEYRQAQTRAVIDTPPLK